jgi:hypothetical protein
MPLMLRWLVPTPATSPASLAEHVAAGAFERAGQAAALRAGDLADQHLAHAAGRAGNGDLHVFPHNSLGLE